MGDERNIRLGMILLAVLGAIALIGSTILQLYGVEGVESYTQLASVVVGGIAGVLVGKNL